MYRTTLLKRLFSGGSGTQAADAPGVPVAEPGYLTHQEALAIVGELVERDNEGHLLPAVAAHAACPQRIYVALVASLPHMYSVSGCAGLCYLQILDDSCQQRRVRVAALPSHLTSANPHRIRTQTLDEGHLCLLLPWDRILQRLETCCVRDVLQVYAAQISGVAVAAYPCASDAEAQPVSTPASLDQQEQPDRAGEVLPGEVFIPIDIALEVANCFTATQTRERKKPPAPRFFWLKALILNLQRQQPFLSTFETVLLKLARHLRKGWQTGGNASKQLFQIQATPIRHGQTCIGWSLIVGLAQNTLRTWGFSSREEAYSR